MRKPTIGQLAEQHRLPADAIMLASRLSLPTVQMALTGQKVSQETVQHCLDAINSMRMTAYLLEDVQVEGEP